jgi:hypothetical protein
VAPPTGNPSADDVPAVPLSTGTAEADITLVNGCLPQAVSTRTETGLEVEIAAGTCVRRLDPGELPDVLSLVVDEAGGPESWTIELEAPAELYGLVELSVRAGESSFPVSFEPSVTLRAELGGWDLDGYWDFGEVLITAPREGRYVQREPVSISHEGEEELSIETSGIVALAYTRQADLQVGRALLSEDQGYVGTIELPGEETTTYPKVRGITLIVGDHAGVVAQVYSASGLGLGQTRSYKSPWGYVYNFRVVGDEGKRFLEIESRYGNDFYVSASIFNEDDSELGDDDIDVVGRTTMNCDFEVCDDQEYDGLVNWWVHGYGDVATAEALRVEFLDAVDDVDWLKLYKLETLAGGAFKAYMWSKEPRRSLTLVARDLPERLRTEVGNRKLRVSLDSRIAYRGRDRVLYTVDFDGENNTPIAGVEPGLYKSLQWSNDRTELATILSTEVHIIDVATASTSTITIFEPTPGSDRTVSRIAWSPDNQWMVVNQEARVFRIRRDGTDREDLGAGDEAFYPTWSAQDGIYYQWAPEGGRQLQHLSVAGREHLARRRDRCSEPGASHGRAAV